MRAFDEDLRAAHRYARGLAAFSHTTALRLYGLPTPTEGPLHLIGNEHCRLRGNPHLLVHRQTGLLLQPPQVVPRSAFQVVRLEQSIIDSWPLLEHDAQRAPAICAVARRLTTPERLLAAHEGASRLPGRGQLANLLDLLQKGCRSPLELWGYQHVFAGPEIASLRWQVPVRLGRRTVYLDILDPQSGVNFELDGAKHHAGATEHERDLRRDAALTELGLTVVRLSHWQLTVEVQATRASALGIMTAHRRPDWRLPEVVRLPPA